MLNRFSGAQSNPRWRYAIMGAFVLLLFAVGFLMGNVINSISGSSSNARATEAARPGGAAVVNPPHKVQDFTLTSDTGEPLSLSDLYGRAVLLFFGYTHCPDECPTTLANFRRAKQALGDNAKDVAFVFISVDGVRDTPEVMREYLNQFDPDFIGLTGDEATLRQMGSEYGLMFQTDTSTVTPTQAEEDTHDQEAGLDQQNYFVQHISPSFLIDQDGYLRMVFFYGTEPTTMADNIRQVLQ